MRAMPQTAANGEVLERLRMKLHGYMEQAAGSVETAPRRAWHVLSYARYLVHVRRRLARVRMRLSDAPVEYHEQLLRQAQIAFLTKPERFEDLSGRTELLEAWTAVLLEAADKLAQDARRSEEYASVAADVDDSRNGVSALSGITMQRWHDA